MIKVESSNRKGKALAFGEHVERLMSPEQGLIDIKSLAYFTSMSERLIFNLMKDPEFPKLKVGRRLLFEKKVVIEYLVRKYGNLASSV